MDPQNAVTVHFNLAGSVQRGMAEAILADESWAGVVRESASGVRVVPFGRVDEAHRAILEQRLHMTPDLLGRRLRELMTGPGNNNVVIIDTPPGPSAYLQQSLTAAELALVVSLADAGSYMTLPIILGLVQTYGAGNSLEYRLILNQVDRALQLGKDVSKVMQSSFGDRVIGLIHQDQTVAESLAFQQSVLDYAPYSQASADFIQCAERVMAMLSADRPDGLRRAHQ
jgi:cellulose synthase operon protein YhjQ